MDWSGVDYCDVFISCLDSHSGGTHSLQSIHQWASDAMLHFSKSIPMKKNSSTSWVAWGWVNSKQLLIFWGELFLLGYIIYDSMWDLCDLYDQSQLYVSEQGEMVSSSRRRSCALVNTPAPCVNKAVSHIQELKSKLENWGQQVEPNITRRWIVLLYTITDQDSTTRIQAIDQNQYHTDQTQIELTVIWIDSHVICFALILHNEWIMNVSCLLGW